MASPQLESARSSRDFHSLFIAAWLLCAVFYFIQYALRSALGVMVPELTAAWQLNPLDLSSLLGLYFFTYASFALVAGASLDRYGAKWTIPAGIACLAVGTGMFAGGTVLQAEIGRLLQGAGSAFSFVGAVYLAARGFPGRYLATAVGATQMFGMLGGFVGQFVVSSMVHGLVTWQDFWLYSGALVAVLAVVIFFATPSAADRTPVGRSTLLEMFEPCKTVLSNPQSYLCGFCAGLLFLPTTIGDMIWGVPVLQQGFGIEHATAVDRAAMVPLDWVFGAANPGLHRRPHGAPQTCSDRERFLHARHCRWHPLSAIGHPAALYWRAAVRLCVGRRHDPLRHHKGSQSRPCQRLSDRRDELPRLHAQRRRRADRGSGPAKYLGRSAARSSRLPAMGALGPRWHRGGDRSRLLPRRNRSRRGQNASHHYRRTAERFTRGLGGHL